MSASKIDEYHLLANPASPGNKENFSHDEDDNDELDDHDYHHGFRIKSNLFSRFRDVWPKHGSMILLITSLAANLLFGILSLALLNSLRWQSSAQSGSSDVSLYGSRIPMWRNVLRIESRANKTPVGLGRDSSVRFPWSTGYGPEITNHSLADERWEDIDINSGIVALPDEWAAEHNLPPTQRFPWDTTKGIYTLSAFHTLHCLKNIHRLLYDAHHSRPLSRDIGHAMHCVDHMRKDAICNADDFLLPTPPDHYGKKGPKGQARVCRNWDTLLAWADEHNACYQHISDDEDAFAAEHDEIERYKNCPQGSPYLETMREYFGPE